MGFRGISESISRDFLANDVVVFHDVNANQLLLQSAISLRPPHRQSIARETLWDTLVFVEVQHEKDVILSR